MKIRTVYWPKPIPSRNFDWSAVDDDTYDGPGSPIGCGATEAQAIEELKLAIEMMQDDSDRYAYEMEDEQRKRDAQEGF